MSDRWDDACRAILVEARQVTVEHENHFLGTEHLAAAMLTFSGSRLDLLLEAHGTDSAEVLEMLMDATTPGPLPRGENIALTPRVRHVVRRAESLREAAGAERISETHLLGALLGGGRGVFVRVLEAFDLHAETLLAALADEIEGREASPPTETCDDTVARRLRPRPRRQEETEAAPAGVDTAGSPAVGRGTPPPREAADSSRSPARPSLPPPSIFPRVPLGGNPALLDWSARAAPPSLRSKESSRRIPSGLLEQLGRDLTEAARGDALPPIVGRESEIDQLQRALCRADRSNPLLMGDAGVGKSAIVAALAQQIVSGAVPGALRGIRLIEIPLAALPLETRYRGALEERVAQMMQEAREHNAVLVIDGIDALAGGAGALGDAGALLRPALARGEVRVIGTVTPSAYARHVEPDTSFARCFHVVRVAAPDPATTLRILQSCRPRFESFHQVHIPDDTLQIVLRLASEHLGSRQMPDAAIDLLDESCVKAASSPEAFEDEVASEAGAWPTVSAAAVAAVVSQRAGVPLERLTRDERARVASVEATLGARVIGQDDAVQRVGHRIRMFKAGFRDELRPLGVLLFLGPTGVGKTELAKAAATFLFGSEDPLVRLDMSEFAEPHQVARLIGPPPGYVGYGEAGQLTEAVRRTPHCVVLLDEIEKAHPRIFDLFLQVFDEGRLTDGRGVTTDFRHSLIVLTSNLGADLWKGEKRIGFRQAEREGLRATRSTVAADDEEGHDDEEDARRKRLFDALKPTFRLEFLNRLDDVILFRPLEADVLARIAGQMVARWQARSAEQGHPFEVDPSVLDLLCRKGFDRELGARPMKRAIEQHLLAPLSRLVLDGHGTPGRPLRAVTRGGRIVFEPQ